MDRVGFVYEVIAIEEGWLMLGNREERWMNLFHSRSRDLLRAC